MVTVLNEIKKSTIYPNILISMRAGFTLVSGKRMFNLYVKNLPHSITENDLRQYFARYGDLNFIEIHKQGAIFSKNALVSFVDIMSAKSASYQRVHHICDHLMISKPTSRRSQPLPAKDNRKMAKRNARKRRLLVIIKRSQRYFALLVLILCMVIYLLNFNRF